MTKFTLPCIIILLSRTCAFAPSNSIQRTAGSSSLSMTADDGNSRRSFLSKAVIAGSAAVGGFALTSTTQSVLPAQALGLPGGGSLNKVNAKLRGYGVPVIDKLADGFSPLAEVWGKGKNRDPLLIQFVHPSDWIVTLPSQDTNGEDGTIQAGQYAKGDTATFYLDDTEGKVAKIAEQPKEFFQKELIKAISQKGDNVYQNFKVTKIVPRDENGQDYMTVDFKYDLLTGAGFEVERRGVASVTSTGKGVQVLWCASTRQRYNKSTESALREMAASFRVYADGLESQKIVYQEREE
mmetsp:Transcript_32116/g.38325  ORF Transcript_32116/g.38325 Transcript_32116/m.38325 type:complete len:295 (-) Transcript_32116:184-1068(-)